MDRMIRQERLIFLVSQPRSGSTLLQHILGSHSAVATLPETWILLPWLYALRPDGHSAEYRSDWAAKAIRSYLDYAGTDEQAYYNAVRSAALSLYWYGIANDDKACYFVDKTPRYYFILPEIRRTFPRATLIILLRNPLSVLASILEENLDGRWSKLFTTERFNDIFTAPQMLAQEINEDDNRTAVVRYEKLVTDPEATVSELCDKIGLRYEPQMLQYGGKVEFRDTTFRDTHAIYSHREPVANYLNRWQERLDSLGKVCSARIYFEILGAAVVRDLGYNSAELQSKLQQLCPNSSPVYQALRRWIAPPDKMGPFRKGVLDFVCTGEEIGWYQASLRAGKKLGERI